MAVEDIIDMSGVSGLVGAVGNAVMWGVIILIVGTLVGIGIYLMWVKRSSVQLDAIIIAKRAGSLILGRDKLRITRTMEGILKTRLLGRRINIPPIDTSEVLRTDKGRDAIFIFKYGELDYIGVKIRDQNTDKDYAGLKGKIQQMWDKRKKPETFSEAYVQMPIHKALQSFVDGKVEFRPIESDVGFFRVQEHKDLRARNTMTSILAKYGIHIMVGAIVICLIVVTWIIMGRLETIAGTIASAAK